MNPFLTLMWVGGRISEAKLQTYVPTFITQEDKDLIVATPQK